MNKIYKQTGICQKKLKNIWQNLWPNEGLEIENYIPEEFKLIIYLEKYNSFHF